MTFGHPCPMADLFGVAGRKLLDSLALPEPWQASLSESLALVDDLTARVDALEVELRQLGADHPSMRLLMTVPGVGWVLAYTIASKDRRHRQVRESLRSWPGTRGCARWSASQDRRTDVAHWPRTARSTCAGR
jgi:transposase